MTVVAAGELHDLAATGDTARQSQSAHRRLGARVDQTHLLDRADPTDDLLRERDLARTERAERQAALRCPLDRVDHRGVGMADDGRTPRADEVDVLVAVCVVEERATGPDDEPRRASDRAEGAYR